MAERGFTNNAAHVALKADYERVRNVINTQRDLIRRANEQIARAQQDEADLCSAAAALGFDVNLPLLGR